MLVPKRWLRFGTWINFDDYFRDHYPRDEIFGADEEPDPVRVLRFNRDNYGVVRSYVAAKERTREDCQNDPLFRQIPVVSARRKLSTIEGLPSGTAGNAHRKYEDAVSQLLASLLYPQLDFAAEQSRTVDGVLIRDLILYNNRDIDFLAEIYDDYGSRQLVFELKNVAQVEREHVNQLNRYLNEGLGGFGVIVTRNRLSKAMRRNTIDLWSGQRKCVVPLTDEDLSLTRSNAPGPPLLARVASVGSETSSAGYSPERSRRSSFVSRQARGAWGCVGQPRDPRPP